MLSKTFYDFLITNKLRNRIDFFNCLEIAEKCGKIHSYPRESFDSYGHFLPLEEDNGEPYIINATGLASQLAATSGVLMTITGPEFETYAAFHGNLFFIFFLDQTHRDRLVRVYMKKPDESWVFGRNFDGCGFNILKPVNTIAEVFLDYSVDVFGIDRCTGQKYKSGTWNKAFYQTVNSFVNKVEGFTEINQIKEAYKNGQNDEKEN